MNNASPYFYLRRPDDLSCVRVVGECVGGSQPRVRNGHFFAPCLRTSSRIQAALGTKHPPAVRAYRSISRTNCMPAVAGWLFFCSVLAEQFDDSGVTRSRTPSGRSALPLHLSHTNRLPAVAGLPLVHADMWFEARVPSCRTTTGTWNAILPKIFAYLGA